ncbi:SAVED domain-containing protein [Bradyrhizobium sp. 149]|uniref:SAVED domain-containing protein n=1 Tax=Bradyrhizobium sp. 149 TaxID=2782624 RepID=UPI001FF9296F|nr:SAVED domain-containing protein [Bradyrhizobium sp. 149]MCK1651599.1 SAVED domain-containing protein [Bradyrhizobium sp. 149]
MRSPNCGFLLAAEGSVAVEARARRPRDARLRRRLCRQYQVRAPGGARTRSTGLRLWSADCSSVSGRDFFRPPEVPFRKISLRPSRRRGSGRSLPRARCGQIGSRRFRRRGRAKSDRRSRRGSGAQSVTCGRHAFELPDAATDAIRFADTDGNDVTFVAAPNAFTFFLGQRQNALGRVRLYEFDFDGGRSYTAALTLPPGKAPT